MKHFLFILLIIPATCIAQLPGDFDNTYSGDGKKTFDAGTNSNGIWAVATQPDGKLVAAGESLFSNSSFLVVRFAANSNQDVTFSGDGCVTTSFYSGYDAKGRAIAMQPDG